MNGTRECSYNRNRYFLFVKMPTEKERENRIPFIIISPSFLSASLMYAQAAPAAPGSSIKHSGPVRQLSGRGLLQSWKKRHCVLDGQRLFFYQPASAATTTTTPLDKTSHYIDLSSYDICEEAAIGHKDVVRRCSSPSQAAAAAAGHQQQHVLVISSADIEKGSHRFFDTVRAASAAHKRSNLLSNDARFYLWL